MQEYHECETLQSAGTCYIIILYYILYYDQGLGKTQCKQQFIVEFFLQSPEVKHFSVRLYVDNYFPLKTHTSIILYLNDETYCLKMILFLTQLNCHPVIKKSSGCWNVMLCNMAKLYQHFKGPRHIHLQGKRVRYLRRGQG